MRDDTDIGGPGAAFPETLWTAVLAARDRGTPDYEEGLARLVERYWKPVYWVIRRHWHKSNEEAKDLTQEFFASFLEKPRLSNVGPEKGRFRTYIGRVLANFLRDRADADRTRKRGGATHIFSMHQDAGELPLAAAPVAPDELLDRAWAQNLFEQARAELRDLYRREGKDVYATAFERRELAEAPPTYAQLASSLGISVHDVENYLKHARASFARILRARVRETVDEDSDVESELRYLSEVLRRTA